MQLETRLRPQKPEDVFHPVEVLASGGIAIECDDLVAGLQSLALGVAARTHATDVAVIANHQHRKAVIMHIWPWRRKEECMRVVETIQKRGNLGKRPVH